MYKCKLQYYKHFLNCNINCKTEKPQYKSLLRPFLTILHFLCIECKTVSTERNFTAYPPICTQVRIRAWECKKAPREPQSSLGAFSFYRYGNCKHITPHHNRKIITAVVFDCVRYGGGEGSWTPVRKYFHMTFSGCSRELRFPPAAVSLQTAAFGSFICHARGKAYPGHVHRLGYAQTRAAVNAGRTAAWFEAASSITLLLNYFR